jgi:hypothetical protein
MQQGDEFREASNSENGDGLPSDSNDSECRISEFAKAERLLAAGPCERLHMHDGGRFPIIAVDCNDRLMEQPQLQSALTVEISNADGRLAFVRTRSNRYGTWRYGQRKKKAPFWHSSAR